MKKGLLTVLLASLVLVGCQNYDDQFDDLNAQISALKSQVDGLSSLSGQVSSLSGTISGLQSGIAAAQAAATSAGSSADAATAAVNAIPGVDLSGLTASLATLQAEVDAIEAAIATTATAAEVAALQTSLTAVETDLADLLTSNNVYAVDITVNSAASMASALALGNKVALMNADVSITDKATIADADIQTFVNRIKTMNGTFTYDSGSATGFVPTFDEMVAGTVFALTPAGPLSFKKLASATTVTITTSYATKITSLDMSALTALTSFNTGTVNQLHLSSATNVDLGELTRYGSALSIQTKKGATLDIAKLDDKTTAGVQSDIALTLNGPASVNLSLIADGTIALSNIESATVSAFYGTLDVNAGVETLTTTDSVTIDLDGATDLVTATLDYKYDWDPDLTTANAAIAAAGYSASYLENYNATGSIGGTDLKTLTITGDLLDLYLDEANLETLSINANMTALTMSTLTDLTSLTVSGKVGSISLTNSPNIAVADFNHTTNLEQIGSATALKSVSFVVTDNLGLTKLHTTGDLVHTFTVTGNDALTELDMTGLKTRGTEITGGAVNLWDNDLTAVKSTDTTDTDASITAGTDDDGEAGDLGTTDDGTSGMDTMKVYLTAIAADTKNTAQVNFDTVSTFDDSETTTTATTLNTLGSTSVSATLNDATVLKMTPAVANTAAGASDAIKAMRGFIIDVNDTAATMQFTVNGVALFDTTTNGTGTNLVMNNNSALDIAAIESAVNLTRAAAANVAIDAKRGGNSSQTVSLVQYGGLAANTTATVIGQRYTSTTANAAAVSTTNYGFGVDDTIKLTVGTNSVTISPGAGGATTLSGLADDVVAAWTAKYGSGGTASAAALATVANSSGILTVTMSQVDSAGYDVNVDVTVTAGTVTATNAANIDYVIGASTLESDDATVDTDIILTIESLVAGVDENTISTLVTAVSAAGSTNIIELSTDYTANSTWAKTGLFTSTTVERTDVRTAEDSVDAATTNAVAAVLFNRTTWLG